MTRAIKKDSQYYLCPFDIVPLASPIGLFQGLKNGNVHYLPTNGNSFTDHLYDNKQFKKVRQENGMAYQKK